jgi:hypothetical protein
VSIIGRCLFSKLSDRTAVSSGREFQDVFPATTPRHPTVISRFYDDKSGLLPNKLPFNKQGILHLTSATRSILLYTCTVFYNQMIEIINQMVEIINHLVVTIFRTNTTFPMPITAN